MLCLISDHLNHKHRRQRTRDKNRLGRTNLMVSRIGFGGIPIQRCAEDDAIAVVKGMWERAENPAMRKGLARNLATLRQKRAALRKCA